MGILCIQNIHGFKKSLNILLLSRWSYDWIDTHPCIRERLNLIMFLIPGLSYDWINDHLYWSQTGPDGIFLINPDSPEDFLQIASGNSTYNPRGVIVVPHNK